MWHLQWLFGAARVEGAAAGTGENSEQVFAYLHRRAPTTKNMSVSGIPPLICQLLRYVFCASEIKQTMNM